MKSTSKHVSQCYQSVVATNSKVSYNRLLVVVDADKPDDQPTITAVRCVVTADSKEPGVNGVR